MGCSYNWWPDAEMGCSQGDSNCPLGNTYPEVKSGEPIVNVSEEAAKPEP